ncbi:MAG: flippase-like domain-containing protein [Proteobacteria bacterium]|nr:flippase-like domain-containing protein [Pseudomonadota bacterium]
MSALRAKPVLAWAVRLCVALGLMALAFRIALPAGDGSAWLRLREAWTGTPAEMLAWFALASAVLGINLAVGAWRFQLLLGGAGHAVPGIALFRGYLVATFFNTLLPGAVLGDVYRVVDARREMRSGSRATGLVVLERLFSLAALGVLVLAVALALAAGEVSRGGLGIVVPVALVLTALGLVVFFPGFHDGLRRLVPAQRRFPRLWGAVDQSLGAAADAVRSPARAGQAFVLSLVGHLLPALSAWLLAQTLHSSVAWPWYAAFVPFIALVSLLPVSIGGAGVRELLYVELFGAVGMRPEVALALALSVFASSLVWAGIGGLAFALGRGTGRASEPSP